ncbi:MAG: ribosome biogenesis GTP-binding protein YsxC [Gemmatimonadetes bacterium]|nr:MAG: ribosome biogenesis GTP-binding protein YsxC [Gemmatimonadota bacterium]
MRHRRPAPAPRHRTRAPEERSLSGEPRFIGSFPSADVPLAPVLPEVALIGRSNVGKSSLLNALAGRRIAKVSRTPGKTRMMNVFEMTAYYLLDLPGYGYARASHAERHAFTRLVTGALERPRLAGVVWLLDSRREPSAEDRAIQELFAARETPVLAALTKSDKLSHGERRTRERELPKTLELPPDQVIVTSARAGEGIADLRDSIRRLVARAA